MTIAVFSYLFYFQEYFLLTLYPCTSSLDPFLVSLLARGNLIGDIHLMIKNEFLYKMRSPSERASVIIRALNFLAEVTYFGVIYNEVSLKNA